MSFRSTTGFGAALVPVWVAAFVAWGQADASGAPPRNETEYTIMELRDEATFQPTLERIRTMVDAGVAVNTHWLLILAEKDRFADVENLAVKGILNSPENIGNVTGHQRIRAETLLKQDGKADEALRAAKAYYNVALLRDTEYAVKLLSRCLDLAHPDDSSYLRRFKAQQVEWSTLDTVPDTSEDLGDNVLKSIRITDSAFGAAADAMTERDFNSHIARGNLLLLADRCADARKAFEHAELLAERPHETATAVEGVARAIRAEAGALGPANAYIVAQRGEGQ